LAKEEWVGAIVKFKSGRYGIVLSAQKTADITFITVQVPDMGIITIRTEDVEKIK
tara:strand:- start:209 stop:373 length:165 start_codon:yes stop_codon:yes gene_type:complete